MNRHDFLSDSQVAAFAQWAGHLVTGEWQLQHSYRGRGNGPGLQCETLYEAFKQYRWPDSRTGETFADTVNTFDDYHHRFDEIGTISTRSDQQAVFDIATQIARWGGINNLRISSDRNWGLMRPDKLQAHVAEIKTKLDPAVADTEDLPDSLRMSSSFSKIYSAFIRDLPIYDSRVACALTCLIHLYQRYEKVNVSGNVLCFPIPQHRGPDRCTRPSIWGSQTKLYVASNLKTAWLLQKLLREPGPFASVDGPHRLHALQSALFMLGYTRLADDAVVKT